MHSLELTNMEVDGPPSAITYPDPCPDAHGNDQTSDRRWL